MADYRSQSLKKVAYQLSLDYSEESTDKLLPFLEGFRLFSGGRRKRIEHVLTYEHPMLDYRSYIFDYKFIRGSGKSRRVYYQTVFFIRSKKLGLPAFYMRPESILHSIAEWLKLRSDIDFEDYPEFSKQYELQGDDEDYIRATMNEKVLRFFSENKNWSLEGVNYYLIFYKKNRLIAPQEIKEFHRIGMFLAQVLEAEDLGI